MPDADGLTDDEGIDAADIGRGGLGRKYRDNVAAIRLLKTLATEGRAATVDERKALTAFAETLPEGVHTPVAF